MHKARVEAFSDGVIAILITIMVLEMKVPQGSTVSALLPIAPVITAYVLSFIFIAIYWNNHHHLLQSAEKVNGGILWANAHLLFWLSFIPFATAWMGQNPYAPWPAAIYGVVLICCAIAYTILVWCLISHHGKNSKLAIAIGSDFKGKLSLLLYVTAIPLAFANALVSYLLYLTVAIIWLIPDKRLEKN